MSHIDDDEYTARGLIRAGHEPQARPRPQPLAQLGYGHISERHLLQAVELFGTSNIRIAKVRMREEHVRHMQLSMSRLAKYEGAPLPTPADCETPSMVFYGPNGRIAIIENNDLGAGVYHFIDDRDISRGALYLGAE
jgi:hypothetical protein